MGRSLARGAELPSTKRSFCKGNHQPFWGGSQKEGLIPDRSFVAEGGQIVAQLLQKNGFIASRGSCIRDGLFCRGNRQLKLPGFGISGSQGC